MVMDKVNVMSDSREAFEKVYAQNFEKNGPTWEEDYQFALWAWNEALKWQAGRQALECEPTAIIHKSSPGEYGFYPATGAVSLTNGMHKLYTHHYSVETAIPVSGLGQRKAQQIGKTIGVLVQNQHGEVAAVTDLGRCTWLSNDVVAPPTQDQPQ